MSAHHSPNSTSETTKLRLKVKTDTGLKFMFAVRRSATVDELAREIRRTINEFLEDSTHKYHDPAHIAHNVRDIELNGFALYRNGRLEDLLTDGEEIECKVESKPRRQPENNKAAAKQEKAKLKDSEKKDNTERLNEKAATKTEEDESDKQQQQKHQGDHIKHSTPSKEPNKKKEPNQNKNNQNKQHPNNQNKQQPNSQNKQAQNPNQSNKNKQQHPKPSETAPNPQQKKPSANISAIVEAMKQETVAHQTDSVKKQEVPEKPKKPKHIVPKPDSDDDE